MSYKLFLPAIIFSTAAFAAEHRVDCARPEWRDLTRLNTLELQPGDRVRLKSGCVWKAQHLALKGSGAPGRPIVVDRYGPGPLPRIDADGRAEDALLIRNQQWIEVRELELTNRGTERAVRRGVHIWADDFGDAAHIWVTDLFVHDVNGVQDKKDNGGIIWRTSGRSKPTRFDDLRIERNIVWRVDRSAIAAQSAFYDRRRWHPSLRVVLRDNLVDDIGGDGVVPWASDGALVEHNIARDCNKRADSYNAGIWPWSCDNTVLRLNEASFTRTQKDGQGFDSDYNSRNTVIEFNYSHDNEGGFLLICTPSHDDPAHMLTNIGVDVRYNISRNDHVRTFHLPGPVEKVRVYENAVYVGKGAPVNIVQFSDWKGWANDVEFARNLFFVAEGGAGRYGHELKRTPDGNFTIGPGFGPVKNVRFRGNTYIGNHTGRPEDGAAKTSGGKQLPASIFDAAPVFSVEPADASLPGRFRDYLQKHRAWMVRVMEEQFGKRP